MNYQRIHDNLIEYVREADTKERIAKRNILDPRLSSIKIYVETHHITPKSLGGSEDLYNLVELLPEEHIFVHMLRYKIYQKREDALAVRFMLNGYLNNSTKNSVKKVLTKKIRMGYCWIRTHAQNIRENEGWHTPSGAKRISESRKGKMYVKDSITGEKIAMVSINHPKVLSGEWVHHTKGRVFSEKECQNKRAISIGSDNPNHSGLPDDYFYDKGAEVYKEVGRILSWDDMIKLSKVNGFKWIKSCKSRFNGLGVIGYYAELEHRLKVKYDAYYSRKNFSKRNPE